MDILHAGDSGKQRHLPRIEFDWFSERAPQQSEPTRQNRAITNHLVEAKLLPELTIDDNPQTEILERRSGFPRPAEISDAAVASANVIVCSLRATDGKLSAQQMATIQSVLLPLVASACDQNDPRRFESDQTLRMIESEVATRLRMTPYEMRLVMADEDFRGTGYTRPVTSRVDFYALTNAAADERGKSDPIYLSLLQVRGR